MFKNIMGSPITTWGGVTTLIVGGTLLFCGKITWEQFLIFAALFGIGAVMKDPQKKDE
jgi:hypothetical protein